MELKKEVVIVVALLVFASYFLSSVQDPADLTGFQVMKKTVKGPVMPPPAGVCGDGQIDPGEECGEPGLSCTPPSMCNTNTCICVKPRPMCGDGLCSPGETPCNCPSDCTMDVCGDGCLSGGESCEEDKDCFFLDDVCLGDCTCGSSGVSNLDPWDPANWDKVIIGRAKYTGAPPTLDLNDMAISEAYDLDNDGYYDIVGSINEQHISTEDRGFRILYNNGDDTYTKTKVQNDPDDTWLNAQDIEFFDWDGDGYLDMFTHESDFLGYQPGTLKIWFNPQSRTLDWPHIEISSNTNFMHHFRIGDYDGDGNMDVAYPVLNTGFCVDNSLFVFFAPDPSLARNPSQWQQVFIGCTEDWGLDPTDYDNDGDLDIVSFDRVFTNPHDGGAGNPRLGNWNSFQFTTSRPSDIFVGDIDQDNCEDIVLTEGHDHREGDGSFEVNYGDCAGGYTLDFVGDYETNEGLFLIDLDDDGDLDAVMPSLNNLRKDWNDPGGDMIIFENVNGAFTIANSVYIQQGSDKVGHEVFVAKNPRRHDRIVIYAHNVGAVNQDVPSYVEFRLRQA